MCLGSSKEAAVTVMMRRGGTVVEEGVRKVTEAMAGLGFHLM